MKMMKGKIPGMGELGKYVISAFWDRCVLLEFI